MPIGGSASSAPLAKVRVTESPDGSFLAAVEVVVGGEVVAQLPTHRLTTIQDARALTETTIALHGDWVERVRQDA